MGSAISVVLAFAAAFANALNVVTQHVASTAAPRSDKGWRLALYLVRNPLWLIGVAATVAAFVLQAAALFKGQLSVVQTILVTEIVFSLLIGWAWLHRDARPAAWVSAVVVCAGLAVFLLMSEPQGGHRRPTASAWVPVIIVIGATVAVLTVLGGRGSPRRRAAMYATGSAVAWAMMATLLKSTTELLANDGVLSTLARADVYGLIIAAATGTILTQAALHNGPLAVSQPLMVSVDPFVSILLGIWLYGEHFTHNALKVTLAVAGFAMIVVGTVALSRTAPSLESQPFSSRAGPSS
jgi:drug/metabolite transporter (DMT)-like permease